ncbi:hypothetical protein L596_006153 [Steinernema carpocapsae]|uniref:Hypoxia up-regulated protein 1 n=1 Tax=Steinernema carpocapsae TaxID=34508 RepID=A0A4U8V2P0_STECR|nr:hypothetical protein L596_006153 [Steinernema carpocapsae]
MSSQNWIAIDMGSASTRVAQFNGQNVEILLDERGNPNFPTTIALINNTVDIGVASPFSDGYDYVIHDFKPQIAERWFRKEHLLCNDWTPLITSRETSPLKFQLFQPFAQGGNLYFNHFAALILAKTKTIAETKLNETVENVVLTVPEAYTYLDRMAFRQAALEVGFTTVRFITDTLAAALHHKYVKNQDCPSALVVNVGQNFAAASVIDIQGSALTVKAVNTMEGCAGKNIDHKFIEAICELCDQKMYVDEPNFRKSCSLPRRST